MASALRHTRPAATHSGSMQTTARYLSDFYRHQLRVPPGELITKVTWRVLRNSVQICSKGQRRPRPGESDADRRYDDKG